MYYYYSASVTVRDCWDKLGWTKDFRIFRRTRRSQKTHFFSVPHNPKDLICRFILVVFIDAEAMLRCTWRDFNMFE